MHIVIISGLTTTETKANRRSSLNLNQPRRAVPPP